MNKKNKLFQHVTSVGRWALPLGLCLLAVFVQPFSANAAIKEQVNYQGRLLSNTGAVVADGTYNMRFKIYEGGNGCVGGGSSPCSGTLKWTEEWKQTNRVTVANGYFSVYLGSITAFGTSVDWNNATLWLSVDVGGTANTATPTYDGEMLPFRSLASVPQAFQSANSSQLNGLASSAFVQLAQGIQTDSSSTNPSIYINKTAGTAALMNLQRGGTSVFTVGNSGSANFKTTTDSVTGFQVSDADGGTPVLNVDTDNERVGIKTAAPTVPLQVNGQTVIGDGVPVFNTEVPGYVDLTIVKNGGAAAQGFGTYSSTATDGGSFFGVRGRGTQSSPTSSSSGDLIFQLGASGTTTTGTAAALLGNASTVSFLQDAAATSTTAPAAILLNTQNTERVRVTSGGKVGIGTSSPSSQLHVALDNGTLPSISSSTGVVVSNNSATSDNTNISVLAGTAGNSAVNFSDTSEEFNGIIEYNHTNDMLRFYANTISLGNYSLGINSSGALIGTDLNCATGNDSASCLAIGNASAGYNLHVRSSLFSENIGAGSVGITSVGNVTTDGYFSFSGTAQAATSICRTNATPSQIRPCSSLRSLKDNIQDLNLGLDTVNKLQPRRYTLKSDKQEYPGFIAEEVEQVDPILAEYVIDESGKNKLTSVKYDNLTAVLAKAVQELDDKVEAKMQGTAPSEVAGLQQQITELSEKVDKLATNSDKDVLGASTTRESVQTGPLVIVLTTLIVFSAVGLSVLLAKKSRHA